MSAEPAESFKENIADWPSAASPSSVRGRSFAAQVAGVLATLHDGFVMVDNGWRLTFVNATAARMWREAPRALIGQRIFDPDRSDPDNPFQAAFLASKASDEPVTFVALSKMFSAWVEVQGYPHADGYAVLFRDISGERRASRMEKTRDPDSAHSINQRIFDNSLDLILVVDRDGRFTRVSPSSLAILGYAPEDMVGRNAVEFLDHADLERTRSEMRLARRGRQTRNFECRYRHKDGRPVSIAWTGVWSEPDYQYFFIGRDMTRHIELEQQLRQAQKMEAVGQLTGGVAHDFNNLLTIIIGMTELLTERLSGDAELAAIVKSIDEAAERGSELTKRMLAFARKQPLQSRPVDINEIVLRASVVLKRTLGEDIAITTVLPDNLWMATADPSQVEDAILNIAVNARDAMPNGGKLTLETANVYLDKSYAEHNAEVTPGEYVALIITDSGCGMPPEVLERVFEPFYTTKEVGRGTGLGLSMVYGFAKQSRGHAKIYSEIGHGTSVKLYLPRAEQEEARVEAAVPIEPRHGDEIILVVEDDPVVRKVAVGMLTGLGYRVREAGDGRAALDILQTSSRVDLLFTDLVMPNGISGQGLLQAARKLRPGLKALFTSGYSSTVIRGRSEIDRDVPLLSKPYRKQELAAAVHGALDRGN